MPPTVRNVDQILAELDPAFNPQRQLIKKQQAAIPGNQKAGRQRLRAEQKNAFGDITTGANRRGLNFSGIPLAEQAEHTADVFLPGMTDLESQGQQQGFALQGALNDILSSQRGQAQDIRQREQDRLFSFQQEERAAARARSAAAAQQRYDSAGISEAYEKRIAELLAASKDPVASTGALGGNSLGIDSIIQDPGSGKFLDTTSGREVFRSNPGTPANTFTSNGEDFSIALLAERAGVSESEIRRRMNSFGPTTNNSIFTAGF